MSAPKKVGLLDHAFGGLNALMAVGSYRKYRRDGLGRIQSLARSVWDFGVMGTPLMMTMQFGSMAASMLNNAAMTRIARTRTRTMGFTTPITDTQEIASSRSQLMQSAISTNRMLSLSGKSFAGSEAAIMHRRYST